ncbi:MAG: D-tyrosyl-tRNA(Tyr) deacylase [Verrucomicrobiales bacterium]|jgi:D-tyrosyl-tRNA(Tyr) deacylase
MIAIIQRVSEAQVMIEERLVSEIGQGMLILLGIEDADDETDVAWLTGKLVKMRVFSDDAGLMNLSLIEVKGSALIVSQFTLHASTKKGNRPSLIRAARPEKATPLYEKFIEAMKELLGEACVETGEFGADMQVSLTNDGPVTIPIDSRNRQ